MATTQNTFTGNGSNLGPFSFTFKWLESTDIKVTVGGVLKTAGTHYNLQSLNYTTKTGGEVLFTAGNAPANGASIRIYRDTDDEALSAAFSSGSAIRAKDLNDNFTQNLYVTQEVSNNSVNIDGSNPMVGDLDMAGYEVINLGTPTSDGAAVNKQYVDSRLGNLDIPGFTRWTLTAVGGETTLSGAGTTGGTLAYSAGREQVYLNGAQQQRGVDYTADNGTSVVFNVALTAGDVVEIICVNNLNTGTTAQAQDVSFVQSGAGAVTRSVENKLRDVVSVKDFGAVGDGVTDDTAAIQAAINVAISISNTKPTTLVFPSGDYKTTAPLEIVASGGKRLEIIGGAGSFEAATIKAGYHGYGTGANPKGVFYIASSTPGGYARSVAISGFLIERISASFRTPPAIEAIGAAQSRFNNITVGSWSNTAYRFDTPQNCRCINLTAFSGGNSFPYKDASTVTVTQSGTTLTASGNIFSSSDVNKWVAIWGTGSSNYRRKAKIVAYISPTEVTVEQSVIDATPRNLLFGSPFLSTTSGSTTVTADANCFTAEDVGLQIWLRYPSGADWHRATITSFTSPTQVTISDPAPATSGSIEFGCAAFELYTSGDVFGDSSDNKFVNLQIENHDGIGVVIDNASVLEMVPAKIHSEQDASVSRYSLSAMWIHQADGFFSGSWDAQYIGAYRFWGVDQTAAFHFANLITRTALDEVVFGIGPKNTNYDGACFVFDSVTVFGANPTAGIRDLVIDQNTSTPGYCMTGCFVNRGDSTDYVLRGHVNQNVYVDDSGSAPILKMQATNRTYSLKSSGGAGFNRFTVRDETGAADRLYVYSTGAVSPGVDNSQDLGLTTGRWLNGFIANLRTGAGTVTWTSGSGTPEGVLTAPVGSLYTRTDGGAGTTLYIKESGTGNTGWVAK